MAAAAPTQMAVPSRPLPVTISMRDMHNQQSFGALLNAKVKQSRVLLIGAGGVGCELLKNLVLTGFGKIDVVDLDTIDLSNLNRQFLFRHEHIKKPKALIAKEAAQRFNPSAEITTYHANIKDRQFSISWFTQFAIVFNALDNLEARRYVNRMCLAAGVPLIESGTTGFNGQTQVIIKGVTACYDCWEKPVVKSFPTCTIRSTPSQPIHCIVWGKSYLLNEIFGVSEDESAFDRTEDGDNASEIEELKKESEALRKIRESVGTERFAQMVFDKVFDTDIQRLRSIEDMWRNRRPPEPLQFEAVMAQATAAGLGSTKDEILRAGQKVWTLEENLVVFVDSLDRLGKRMLDMKAAQEGGAEPIIMFDKDDEDTLDFVTASANIRSTLFGIDRKSRFDIKQMAGNIIPAIATTNAIVAGLCVLEGLKILRGAFDQVKEIFLMPHAKSNRLLGASKPMSTNPKCPVCSIHQTTVSVDLSRATLNDLVENFLRMELGYGEKELVVNNDGGLLYDIDETENLSRKLTDLGITAGSMLTIIDEDDQDPCVNVIINVEEQPIDAPAEKTIEFVGQPNRDIPRRPKAPSPAPAPGTNGHSKAQPEPGESVMIIDPDPSRKRPRTDDVEQPDVKRAKTGRETSKDADAAKDKGKGRSDDEPVVIEDAGGAIVILDD